MPVWTPGSYLVREYSRHVSRVTARGASGGPVPVAKTAKNTWRVDASPGERVVVSWVVYGHELTVRTNHVDSDHAFLHPAATYLYVRGREPEPVEVRVEAPEGWRTTTSLPLAGDGSYRAEDLDHLLDSPLEIGPHRMLTFEVNTVPHRVALVGQGNADLERLAEDLPRVCGAAADLFAGEIPPDAYTFIFHILEGAGGGLEHRDGSVCGFPPFSFRPERRYLRQLSLIAHEYFHLWNGKRIRPRELGPFDYTRENPTRLLWVAEGFTSYYQWIILRRAGLAAVPEVLDELALLVRTLGETPGREVEPVAEASFDAWIKLYRPDENTRNSTVSYYLKGALVALALDLEIRDATEGDRSLDDVMRSLWSLHRSRPAEGYTEEELRAMLGEAAGRRLDREVDEWVHTTAPLPLEALLEKVGLRLTAGGGPGEEREAWLGITTREERGAVLVREVLRDSPAAAGGLAPGDELVAFDGWRLGPLADRLGERRPGEEVRLTVTRRGRLREVRVVLGERPPVDVALRPAEHPGEREEKLFAGWLGAPLSEAAREPAPRPPDPRPRPR